MEKISFIANTGIQFFTTEARFNPSEAAIVNDVPVRPLIFTEVFYNLHSMIDYSSVLLAFFKPIP